MRKTLSLVSHRKPDELLVVALDPTKHFLTVALQLLQLLLDDGSVHRFALLDQRLALVEDVLDLGGGEGDLLLEGLRAQSGVSLVKLSQLHKQFNQKGQI